MVEESHLNRLAAVFFASVASDASTITARGGCYTIAIGGEVYFVYGLRYAKGTT
jgi:hypothetical protein